ncbi:MAG: GIY-YIG nuclease family protein [Candidatus Aenigmarchaeota archaeon]|nr:GIY-YIG nuclease family protein [Candidatus Aenigmarchaeota archaeon]
MKGSYIILIGLDSNKKIKIGKLGKINFRKGRYAYVGSALNSLEGRISRHLRKEKKKHWHIDYLLANAEIEKVFYIESSGRKECDIAKKFSDNEQVKGFGCSDCGCNSHLFYLDRGIDFEKIGLKEWRF